MLDGNFKFHKDFELQLKKLIKRESDKLDSDRSYQDILFEFSMVSRFASELRNLNIDLSTECDIIIDNNIAIECKYIHSEKKIKENLKSAKKQLYKRISIDKQANFGIIAIDLSHLLSSDTFNGIVDCKLSTEEITEEIMLDEFKKWYSGLIIGEFKKLLEDNLSVLWSNADDCKDTAVLLVQSYNFCVIDFGDSYIPFVSRQLYPIYNPNLDTQIQLTLSKIIKSLETGF